MGIAGRIAYKLPSVKALQQHAAKAAEERDALARQGEELCLQRDALELERNELAAHCRRLEAELRETLDRQRGAMVERDEILSSRDALQQERDELSAHCHRLERQLAERLEAEQKLRAEVNSLAEFHQDFMQRAMQLIGTEPLLHKMRTDWDVRARMNALHYTNTARDEWDEAEYHATGEQNVSEQICNDLGNICQGSEPSQMRVLEIGCGAGRMTKPLARLFGEVHAVDISEEMIRIARRRLAEEPNAFLYQNNGMDLKALPAEHFDFALSFIVFQHIPSKDVIAGYIREVHRVLKPGRLFKFQVQGGGLTTAQPLDTWFGVSYTRAEMQELASKNGFEMRHAVGEGTQDFWLWFLKK
jgi:SAM-dependent methyltransferase